MALTFYGDSFVSKEQNFRHVILTGKLRHKSNLTSHILTYFIVISILWSSMVIMTAYKYI